MNVDHLEPLCLHQPTTWNRTSTWMSHIKVIPNLDQCGILKPMLLIIFDLKTPHIISARKEVTWRTLGHWPRCGTTPALGRPVATLLGQQPPADRGIGPLKLLPATSDRTQHGWKIQHGGLGNPLEMEVLMGKTLENMGT